MLFFAKNPHIYKYFPVSTGYLSVLSAMCLCLLQPLLADTDLNVTLIERTPRYDYDAAKNNPDPGDTVTFHGHIVNWSDTSIETEYIWIMDDEPFDGDYVYLEPGQELVVTTQWQWQNGNHTITLITDPYNDIEESSEENNIITDRTNALIAGFWVEQSVYDYFHEYQHELQIGSNSWQDWIQRQMAYHNQLCEDAVWPISPNGVTDRVRIDKIIVVPDGALPLNGGLPSNNPDTSDKTVDLMWGFDATCLDGSMYADHTSTDDSNFFYLEQSLIHELGHARYLIDCYGFDTHNTSSHHSVQIWEGDTYVAGSEYMPFLAWGEVLYYNKSGGVMSGPYGFIWSPYEAAALNLIAGNRAVCGNCNAPCNIGVFLQDLPQNNHVQFIDTEGKPWIGADVRIYQAQAGPGWYGKTIDNTPDQQYSTDGQGYVHLPRNPFNPGGKIIHTYGHANSVFVFRIAFGSQVWYRFMEVSDYNMQYWQGNTQDAYYQIELEGSNFQDETPPADPNNLTCQAVDFKSVALVWEPSTDDVGVAGYNIFRDDRKIATVTVPAFTDTSAAPCSTYVYTVNAFDYFHQSGLSNPCTVNVPAHPQDTDLTDDLVIDLADVALLCGNWLLSGCGVTGDITGDSLVDLLDFNAVAADFGTTVIIDNWPMKQHDMHNTGRAYYTVPARYMNNTFFDNILWQKPSPGDFSSGSMSFFSSVGPEGQDIVAGTYHWPKGTQGMDRHTGSVLWYGNTAGGETIGRITPAFSNDGSTIYVTNDATDGELMAFAATTGPSSFWDTSADLDSRLNMLSPTISPDGRIWLHSWNERPFAGTDHGDSITQTWAAQTSVSACLNDPALYDNNGQLVVISGGRTNQVRCWDDSTASELWSTTTHNQAPADASATIDPQNGNIYIPAGFNDIFIIGLDINGSPLWSQTAIRIHDSQSGASNPQRAQSAGCLSHDGKTFYFQTNSSQGSGLLYAVSTIDGSVKWSYPTNSRGWEIHSSCPIVTMNNVIIIGNNENDTYLAIHDTPSGPVLLDTLQVDDSGNAQASATLSADGILYLPLKTEWTQTNGDLDIPTYEVKNVFTALKLY